MRFSSSQYKIFTPQTSENGFAGQLNSLYQRYVEWCQLGEAASHTLLQVRFYVSDAINNVATLKQSQLYHQLSQDAAVSVVEQPPLEPQAKVALFVWFLPATDVEKTVSHDVLHLKADGTEYLVHNVQLEAHEVEGLDAEAQTKLAFERHIALLKQHGMTLEKNCRRTWLFVRDIDYHYAAVVKGRNEIFSRERLTADTHFIASTGIGGYSANPRAVVSIEFLSISEQHDERQVFLSAPDYLNPTHEYGVAFERGTALTFAGQRHRFISGTASIDNKGQVVHLGDVGQQTERLFLNINELLKSDGADLSAMRYCLVYLRDIADASRVKACLNSILPHPIPVIILEARVCRPGWLIEVEGMA